MLTCTSSQQRRQGPSAIATKTSKKRQTPNRHNTKITTMDVFDFDEDDDDGLESPPASPKKRVVKFQQAPASSEEPASVASSAAPSKDEPSPPTSTGPSPQASSTATIADNSTATSVISVARSNPLRGRGTKHARAREKQKAAEEQRRKIELLEQNNKKNKPLLLKKRNRQENNGISPNKNNAVRFSKHNQSSDEEEEDDNSNNNKNDGSSSAVAPPNRDDVFAAHRKRRKINGKTIKKRIAAGRFGRDSSSKARLHNNNMMSPPDDTNDRHSLMSPPLSSSSVSHRSTTSSSHYWSLSEQIQQKLQKHERQQQKMIGPAAAADNNDNHPKNAAAVVVVSRKVRGAGQDVYAMQDAGNFQMMHDECAYLASMIVSCPASHIPAKTNLIDSVAELALLLSDTKTRRTLWGNSATTASSKKTTSRGRRRQHQHKEDNENVALEGILDVLRHTTSALAEKFDSGLHFYALLQKLNRADPNQDDDDGETKGSTNTKNKGKPRSNIVETYHRGLLLDSLAAIVSSLSWDCTIDNRASAYFQNATGAKSLRKAILQHEGALTAIMYIIRHSDPMVSSILEAQVPEEMLAGSSSVTSVMENSHKQQQHETQASGIGMSSMQQSPSKSKDGRSVASSQDNESVVTSSTREDPTMAGRRKRKRKKGGSMLDAIAEDESVALSFTGGTTKGTMTPPRSPPRVVFRQPQTSSDSRSKLSFTSEDAMSSPPRSRSPLRRRGRQSRQGLDDDSSMNSCDSTLLKIHDRLGKIRAKFVQPAANAPKQQLQQQHALANSKSHECQGHRELPLSFGGKDPAGSAASMALDALHRLLAGKEEGDTHSCLDDIEEESPRKNHDHEFMSPGSEDDEHEGYGGMQDEESKPQATKESEEDELLRNNPLLQTNRMLGASGVIPSLVQGMAETLSAIIEELDQQGPKSNPCLACMQHLFDKFQGLAPVVDNACLLHDDNRTDLCAASIETGDYSNNSSGGTLIGSLVLFLKRWMQHKSKSPKNGKRGPNKTARLLNEMGLSVLRTLTSLTHDNSLAAEQLAIRYCEISDTGKKLTAKAVASWNGVHVVGQVLYNAVTTNEASKNAYDTRIFCLNTLANVVGDEPHGDVRRAILSLKFPPAGPGKGKSSVLFLRWLTQWLMSETESFRDAIMKGSFGGADASSNVHSDRELDAAEHEKLMTAGNGCVLLACLLMGPPKSNAIRGTGSPGSSKKNSGSKSSSNSKMGDMEVVTQKIREIVLAEMPLDDSGSGGSTGTTFIRNTLRAFSNLLYFSVGDLSVAVVAPVRNLISELDKIQVEVEIV